MKKERESTEILNVKRQHVIAPAWSLVASNAVRREEAAQLVNRGRKSMQHVVHLDFFSNVSLENRREMGNREAGVQDISNLSLFNHTRPQVCLQLTRQLHINV